MNENRPRHYLYTLIIIDYNNNFVSTTFYISFCEMNFVLRFVIFNFVKAKLSTPRVSHCFSFYPIFCILMEEMTTKRIE